MKKIFIVWTYVIAIMIGFDIGIIYMGIQLTK